MLQSVTRVAMGIGAVVALVVVGLCLGAPVFTPGEAQHALSDPASLDYARIWQLRAPRTLAAILAGSSFGAAGVLLQRSLGNPLAVPELLGVSGGAAAVVAVLVVLGLSAPTALFPLLALGGAFGGGLLTIAAARGALTASDTLLVGAAVSAALTAITVAVASMARELQLQALLRYLSGSVAEIGMAQLRVLVPWVGVSLVAAVWVSPRARVLELGDDAASAAGVDAATGRLLVLAVAAAAVALPTAFVGPIAWVGFAAPQLARQVPGARTPMAEMTVAAIIGAAIVVGGDVAARTAFAPLETPLGAWTAGVALALAACVRLAQRLVPATADLRRGAVGLP